MQIRTATLTTLALLAFAGNSVLARLALIDGAAGAAAFTAVRLAAGALVLAVIVALRPAGSKFLLRWRAAIALLAYAAGFSFAYLTLTTGTGALILFAAVQLTMLAAARREGDRLVGVRAIGLVAAVAGLIYLIAPGLEAPPLGGALLMAIAGVAWGWYSLLGRGSLDPVGATAGNFLLAAVPAATVWLGALWIGEGAAAVLSTRGLWLAVASGAMTSGLGYVVWYAALRGLTTTQSATVQLTVPVVAAWGGVILLAEPISSRLVIAAGLILGGVALTLRRPAM